MLNKQDSKEAGPLSRDQVVQRVKEVVADKAGVSPGTVEEQNDLENDLGCDSLTKVEIMMSIEEHFEIAIPDQLGERIRTVGDIVAGVLQLAGL